MRNSEARRKTLAAVAVLPLVALMAVGSVACGDSGGTGSTEDGAGTSDDAVADIGTPDDAGAGTEDSGPGPGQDSGGSTDGADDDAAMGSDTGDDIAGGHDAVDPGGDDSPWKQVSLGDVGVIEDLFAIDAHQAYAVGGRRALRFNGTAWAAYGEPGAENLGGIWSDGTVTVVVGEAGFIARRGVDELLWTVESFDTEHALNAVSGRGPDDLYAVGDHGVVLHYGGAEAGWTLEDETNGIELLDVFVDQELPGPEGVLAAGTGGRLVRYVGGTWSSQHVAASDVTLYSVWGREGRLFAVGSGGTITVKDGADGTWKGQTTNLSKPRDLHAVVGTSADEVFAFGNGGSLLKWLGTSWAVQTVAGPANIVSDLRHAAYAKAAGGLPATVLVGALWGGGLQRDALGQWVDMATRPVKGLNALVGDADGTLWAVGMGGLIMARTAAQGWTSLPSPTGKDLFGLTVTADGGLYAVGAAGTVIRRDPDGTTAVLAPASFADLFTVAVDGDQLLVGGKGGTLLRGPVETQTLSPWLLGFTGDVNHIGRGGDGALWFAGAFGQLHRSEDGESAALVPTGVAGGLQTFVPTADGVLVAGANGVLLDVASDGSTELLHELPGLFVYGLHVTETASVAVGWNGTALRLTDGVWTTEETGVHSVLEGVWQDGSMAIAVGRLGSALVRTEAP